ncbi:receptor-like protein 35 [Humulus lupulus]|uniref:receptor-like protein 35 n=1 Tax=Humulus lupulus TaxID=3486 RepID=UPI002B410FC0|nr:receptor-like protein 35 [Humulus lupulus]
MGMLLDLFFFLLIHSQLLISSSSSSPPVLQCNPDERSALLQLKTSFKFVADGSLSCARLNKNRTSHDATTLWNEQTDCCTWEGITCVVFGNVIALDLSCGSLQGTTSSNTTLFKLHHL